MSRTAQAPNRETRMRISKLEVRAAGEANGPGTIVGHAAVFDSPSEILVDWWEGAFREVVDPGAFTKTLDESPDVRALINHQPSDILGRTAAGTLALEQDDIGLASEITLPDTTVARDLAVSINRGDINQMSFAFRVIKDSWGEDAEGMPLRHLQEVSLRDGDVSVVTYPAYPTTDADVRSVAYTLERIVTDALQVERRGLLFPELRDGAHLTQASQDTVRRAIDALQMILTESTPDPVVPLATRRRVLEQLGEFVS